jgi:hypothetical protein
MRIWHSSIGWGNVVVLEWEVRRDALNHRWLKNDFLRHLRAFIVRAGEPKPEWAKLEEFVEEDCSRWRRETLAICDLLKTSAESLSPACLFEVEPLSRVSRETRAWLRPIVHAAWLARSGFPGALEDARAALFDAQVKFGNLAALLEGVQRRDRVFLAVQLPQLKAFEGAVTRLGEAIGRLPHEIRVV